MLQPCTAAPRAVLCVPAGNKCCQGCARVFSIHCSNMEGATSCIGHLCAFHVLQSTQLPRCALQHLEGCMYGGVQRYSCIRNTVAVCHHPAVTLYSGLCGDMAL